MSTIADHLRRVLDQIQEAACHCGRNPDEVRLVAVSKTHPAEAVFEAYTAGQRIFGENKVQEAEQKQSRLAPFPIEWHLIGHLQTNKAKKAVSAFTLIHSVDSPRLIQALETEAAKRAITQHVLLQVNISQEESKSGASVAELETLIQALQQAPHLQCRGLMTIPPYEDDPESVRGYFQTLRTLGEQYRSDLLPPDATLELSMGMSHDFRPAIEEGATYVRIGTAIFGERDYT
jgi:pyridoxal phosphate enzyme (YggS family)